MNINDIKNKIRKLQSLSKTDNMDFSQEISQLESVLNTHIPEDTEKRNPWEVLQLARRIERPKPQDYILALTDDFMEMHGDRKYGDDHAILGGVGYFNGIPVTSIGTRKGKNIQENIRFNFGMPHPEGYRKSLRLAKQAEKFRRPVLCFVDTPGAYCGIQAEERGISQAIADNLYEFSSLKTPIISLVTGEGGSGGALALSVCDHLMMMENSVYSVISPEGCASILFKDAGKAPQAAESLKICATDLMELGIIDEIIPEEKTFEETLENVKNSIDKRLLRLRSMPVNALLEARYEKFRKIGVFEEHTKTSTSISKLKSLFNKVFHD